MTILEDDWTALANLLRQEIEAYGRLFGVLEEQRRMLLKHNLDGILDTNEEMEGQTQVLARLKQQREALLTSLWSRTGDEASPTVSGLMELSPHETKPMLEALLVEVNRLIQQSRHHLERNQMLLRRSHDFGRKFLMMVNQDGSQSLVYQRNGRSMGGSNPSPVARYRA